MLNPFRSLRDAWEEATRGTSIPTPDFSNAEASVDRMFESVRDLQRKNGVTPVDDMAVQRAISGAASRFGIRRTSLYKLFDLRRTELDLRFWAPHLTDEQIYSAVLAFRDALEDATPAGTVITVSHTNQPNPATQGASHGEVK